MNNTSDQTTKPNNKTRLIIGEVGIDTETGIVGKGHSYDNGKTFVVDDTIYGRIYHDDDHGKIWKGIQDQVAKVVSPAKSAADSAVSAADAAVASAQVTSDAVSAIASAMAEAEQGANDAMSRAKSAWDVATGAKEAVTDFDPLLKSAQSDAGKALAQIADTASALSDAKTAFDSDVAAAKNLANTAQTTADNAVKSAGENAKALASQANALSDARKAMDSGIANAKELANAAQATADSAVESASSVADDLTAAASQAKANANGITKVTSDVGLLQTTVANNTGDISTIQETAKQIQQSVSDNAGNIMLAKQTADSAVAVASDAKSNATVAVQTASGASVTAKNAQGDATTAMVTAQDAVTQASDAKSNATIAVQTASEARLTVTNAQGDASIAKQTASDASVQIKNAQGDISKLQTRAGAIETSVANNSGAIADVQATANQLKASVSDNAGNITVAKQTADSAVTVASDAKSNATVAIQTASQASITASNASGQAASAVITANGAMTTASDAKSNATVAVQTASGASLTAINAKSDATVAKQTASEAKIQASNAESGFAKLSIRANKIEANVANDSGAIASVQQTANGLTTTVAGIKANGGGRNLWINSKSFQNTSVNSPKVDWGIDSDGITTAHITGNGGFFGKWKYIYANHTDPFAIGDSETFSVEMKGTGTITIGRESDFEKAVTLTNAWTRYSVSGEFKGANRAHIIYNKSGKNCDAYVRLPMVEKGTVAHDWSPAPDDLQTQFTQIKTSIDGITTTINDPKIGLNATYQTVAGNATTISNVKSDVAQLETTATGLTSRVGNLESKTNTQETAIEQNKNAITLKADQTDVDTVKGTVAGLQSSLTVQGNQIQTKVSASDVSGMLSGYATQDYTQSLVTQQANTLSSTITTVKNQVNSLESTIDWTTKTGSLDMNTLTTTQNIYYRDTNLKNADGEAGWAYIQVVSVGERVTQTVWHDRSSIQHIRTGAVSGSSYNWDAWNRTATNAQISNLTQSLDGLRSTVATKADQSTITQLSNVIQSKVSSDDFNNLKQAVDLQTLDSADINDMRTNGHYFVHNLGNNPIGGWVYVDVTGNGSRRIRQDVYQDNGAKHKYRRWFETYWTGWEEGATYTEINQLKDAINLRVTKGDLISQINLQAGTSLIQSNKLVLDAKTTVITGNAFIPSAAIANLTADQIQAGTLSGSKVHAGDNSGNAIDMGVITADYVGFHAYAKNGDNTYIDLNGIHNYGASYDTMIQQGKITTNYLAVNGGGMIDFRDSNGTGMIAEGSTLTFDVSNTPAGYLSYNGIPVAEIPDGSGGNELAIRYGLSTAIIPDDRSGAQATFSKAAQKIAYMTGTSQGKQMLSGLEVHSDNHHWLGAVNSDATYNRLEINSNNGVNLTWHDNTHFWISDGKAKLYKDTDNSSTATVLEVHGWAWINGWCEAAGHSQHSTLSSKTRIEEADPDHMLDLINQTELTTFAYKSELAGGTNHRHIGPIIDDINDVAQYQIPSEFIAPTKTARDDDNMIGALFGAVQALTKRINTLEEKTK